MKVKELIELLSKCDGEMEVVTEAVIQDEYGFVDIIGSDSVLLLDDCGKSKRAIVIRARRESTSPR